MFWTWQAFHVLYHTDNNVLLGAPTGSGKTISAELAMLHLFNTQPDMKVFVAFFCPIWYETTNKGKTVVARANGVRPNGRRIIVVLICFLDKHINSVSYMFLNELCYDICHKRVASYLSIDTTVLSDSSVLQANYLVS